MRLAEERLLVTGSTSGIGKQTAILCAREGAQVAVHGRNAERGGAVVEAIEKSGGKAIFVAADIGEEKECQRLVDEVAGRLGGLDRKSVV